MKDEEVEVLCVEQFQLMSPLRKTKFNYVFIIVSFLMINTPMILYIYLMIYALKRNDELNRWAAAWQIDAIYWNSIAHSECENSWMANIPLISSQQKKYTYINVWQTCNQYWDLHFNLSFNLICLFFFLVRC